MPGPPDPDCPHPTRKRRAFLDELTDAQRKLLFHGQQETERMKQEQVEREQQQQQMQTQHPQL